MSSEGFNGHGRAGDVEKLKVVRDYGYKFLEEGRLPTPFVPFAIGDEWHCGLGYLFRRNEVPKSLWAWTFPWF
jgi:hypothetical protein